MATAPTDPREGTDPSAIALDGEAHVPPRAKRPYTRLALVVLGDVRVLTQGSFSVGNDHGVGRKNPRCLPPEAAIAAPGGPILAANVRVGDVVWSLSAAGDRVASTVLFARSLAAPASHTMVRVRLADGRSMRASGAHPTSDGRALDTLREGDVVDGASVVGVETLRYEHARTFDLLPASDTGTYWADGILVASTIRLADIVAMPRDARFLQETGVAP